MESREELVQELVKQGLKHGAAAGRVTKAASRLKDEGGFTPFYDRTHSNAVSYNEADAARMRAKLGLSKPIETQTNSPPPQPKTESEHTEQKVKEKPNQEVTPPLKASADSKTIVEPQQNTPSPGSVEQLAIAQGPKKQEEKAVEKSEPKATTSKEAKKVPSWVWFAAGAVALVVTSWIIVHKKGGGAKKEEQAEVVSSPSGVNLASQYKAY